jgi:hypothetical protein
LAIVGLLGIVFLVAGPQRVGGVSFALQYFFASIGKRVDVDEFIVNAVSR